MQWPKSRFSEVLSFWAGCLISVSILILAGYGVHGCFFPRPRRVTQDLSCSSSAFVFCFVEMRSRHRELPVECFLYSWWWPKRHTSWMSAVLEFFDSSTSPLSSTFLSVYCSSSVWFAELRTTGLELKVECFSRTWGAQSAKYDRDVSRMFQVWRGWFSRSSALSSVAIVLRSSSVQGLWLDGILPR